MTIKKLVYDILVVSQECRNSDKKLIWKVYESLGYVDQWTGLLTKEGFMKAPSPESIRRVRQALQRTDLLSGDKLIQPAEEIKKVRVKMSHEKGYNYIQGREQFTFNPVTQIYESI